MISHWRLKIAQRMAPFYRDAAVIVLTGSGGQDYADPYSDLDLALFWQAVPDEATRRAILEAIGRELGVQLVVHEQAVVPTATGPLHEDVAFIGGDATTGFKLDINHRTLGFMQQLIEDVMLRYDTDSHKLEAVAAIGTMVSLVGEPIVAEWQRQVAVYPAPLALRLMETYALRMAEAAAILPIHAAREDWLPYHWRLVDMAQGMVGALLALNRRYGVPRKRVRLLMAGLALQPTDFVERVEALVRGQMGLVAMDGLVGEVLALLDGEMDTAGVRRVWQTRRVAFETWSMGSAGEAT